MGQESTTRQFFQTGTKNPAQWRGSITYPKIGADKLTFLTENILPVVAFLSHCTLPRRKGTHSK